MLKIRLTRTGKRNKSQFRIVVAEGARAVKGKFIEVLGFFDPHTKEKSFKKERILYWISNGAKLSDTVHNMLISAGIIKGKKIRIKVKPRKKEEKEGKEEKQEDKKTESPEDKESVSSAGTEKSEEEKDKPKVEEETKKTEEAQSEKKK